MRDGDPNGSSDGARVWRRLGAPLTLLLTTLPLTATALATPAPFECQGTAPEGFEASYPQLWIGYGSWLMLAAALALIAFSAVTSLRTLKKEKETASILGLVAGSLFGLFWVAASFVCLVLMTIMTVFRNDCHFCAVDRPDLALLGEFGIIISVVVLMGLMVGAAHLALRSPVVRHAVVVCIIPLGFVLWMTAVIWTNQHFIAEHCQPAVSTTTAAPTTPAAPVVPAAPSR